MVSVVSGAKHVTPACAIAALPEQCEQVSLPMHNILLWLIEVWGHTWRLTGIAASPISCLFLPNLLSYLRLHLVLQITIMTFVEPPALLLRDPELIRLFENFVQRHDATFEDGREGSVEGEPLGLQ